MYRVPTKKQVELTESMISEKYTAIQKTLDLIRKTRKFWEVNKSIAKDLLGPQKVGQFRFDTNDKILVREVSRNKKGKLRTEIFRIRYGHRLSPLCEHAMKHCGGSYFCEKCLAKLEVGERCPYPSTNGTDYNIIITRIDNYLKWLRKVERILESRF